MIKQTVILHEILHLTSDYLLELYGIFSELDFNEKLRYGFENVEINKNELVGTLIKQTATNIKSFDKQSSQINNQVIYIVSTIPFPC